MQTFTTQNLVSGKFQHLLMFVFLTIAIFPARAQSLTIITPNGGEVWNYGTLETATWTGQNLSGIVTIEFSYDGGTNWLYFGEVPTGTNGGNASIGVPNITTNNALLKITDLGNPSATDVSDAPFTVNIPSISIWEPNTNSAVFVNTLTQVYWYLNESGINTLNAELSTDNGQSFTTIAENINAYTGFTYITFPNTPSLQCILKLYNPENPAQFGLSSVFSLNPLPVYTLTSPLGGEIVNTYSPFTITWNVENPYSPYNYLEFSADNGATWEVIANGSSEGNTGSIEWITPDANSEQCRIRITDSYAYPSSYISAAFTVMPFPETPVCMVTVDSLTNQNVIVWEKPDSDLIADFLVYKETDEANVYEVIDTVGYNEVAISTDISSNPLIRPYRYKIGFRDSDERVFPAGEYHQTIHLTINQGVNNNWNLLWTTYIGFNYSSYKIMRKSGSGNYEQIATVSSSFNSFTDFNAPSGDISYMVSIVFQAGCNPNADSDFSVVNSNVASNALVSMNKNQEADFLVYPVPANDKIHVQVVAETSKANSLLVADVTGRIVYSKDLGNTQPEQVYTINSSDFANGIYFVHLISDGKKRTEKILVKH